MNKKRSGQRLLSLQVRRHTTKTETNLTHTRTGNITVGNLSHFLPAIVKMVETDAQKRLLSLHALKEVVTHSSHGQLENVADQLWIPLLQNSENSEETTRNVAAACLGKLTTTHPSRYLPQLHVCAILHLSLTFI